MQNFHCCPDAPLSIRNRAKYSLNLQSISGFANFKASKVVLSICQTSAESEKSETHLQREVTASFPASTIKKKKKKEITSNHFVQRVRREKENSARTFLSIDSGGGTSDGGPEGERELFDVPGHEISRYPEEAPEFDLASAISPLQPRPSPFPFDRFSPWLAASCGAPQCTRGGNHEEGHKASDRETIFSPCANNG